MVDARAGDQALGRWPLLLSSREIRGRRAPNRITSTPHATGWSHDGVIVPAEVDYHIRKAAGGCGLVMTFGSASVDPHSTASYGSVSLWDSRNDDALRRLADGVHEHGALCMSQMTHMGRRGDSKLSGTPLRAVSDIPEGVHREVPVVLSTAEIEALVSRFAESAARLHRFGWDGAEITSFGGHLIEQFFDPAINDRDDEYGGSLENRVRFGRQVFAAVREATADDFIIGFRMTGDQQLRTGMTVTELLPVAAALSAGGLIDLFSVSSGTGANDRGTSYFVPGDQVPENANSDLAGAIARGTGIPVITAGRVLDADTAEHALRDQGVDFVGMTRAIIADPDLPRKIMTGGRPRPCISLNEGCIGRLYSGLPMVCSINPAVRVPELDDARTSAAPEVAAHPSVGRVVVVGGGVAGAEAARQAARGGAEVILLEARSELGGRSRIAGRRSGRERWELYLDWLAEELKDAGVDVRLGQTVDADVVAALQPDQVVLATGSRPRTTAWDDVASNILDADDVVEQPPAPHGGGTVIVVDGDGGFVAPTAAESLQSAGWSVRIVTDLPFVAAKVDDTQVWFVRRRLKQAGIALQGSTELVHDGHRWGLFDTETEETTTISAPDLIVHALPRRARLDLAADLAELLPRVPIRRCGDALAPRALENAVEEGARAGLQIANVSRR